MSSQSPRPGEPPDAHIGRKAVELGLLTANQLADVLLAISHPGSKEPPLLAPSLVSRGLLTQAQVGVLSDLAKGAPPQKIGKYVIVRELGRGGMGVVYEARDPELGRQVALKMLLLDFSLSPQERAVDEERFVREARLSANLPKHPHIVGVYEAGTAEEQRFIAMEFVEGLQFSDWRAEKPLRQQITVLRDVALAADHAHQHGVIHRDLKPANILVDAKNQPHVTDFGLAKRGNEASLALTASGAVMGTPAYMSPEQAEGKKDVDHRVDVWALGVMLYETLTGRLPFIADSPLKWIMKTAKEPVPPPSSVLRGPARTGLDKNLEGVCMRALSKNPESRTASAKIFAGELSRWLKGERATAAVPPKKAMNPWAIGGAAAALVAAIVIAVVAISSPSSADLAAERVRDYVTQGQRLLQQGRYSDALIKFGQALDEEPGNRAAMAGRKDAEEKMTAAGKPPGPSKEDLERKEREAIEAELSGLDVEVRKLADAEKFGEARDRILQASKRRDTLDWKDRVATKLEALRKKVDDAYSSLKRDAVTAKERGETGTLDAGRKRLSGWNWPGLAKDLDESLAQVTPAPPLPAPAPAPPPPTPFPAPAPSPAPAPVPVPLPAATPKLIDLGDAKPIELPALKGDANGQVGHANAVHSVIFSADGKSVLTASWDSTVRYWVMFPQGEQRKLSSGAPGTSVGASLDGRWIAAGYYDGQIKIWELPKFQERVLIGNGQQLPALVFSSDSKYLLSGCVDGTARLWDPATGGQKMSFEGHPSGVMSAAANGRLLATGSAETRARVWELPSGREFRRLDLGSSVMKIAIHPSGKSVVTGSSKGILTWWELENGNTRVIGSPLKDIRGLAVSPDGRWLVCGGPEGAYLYDLKTFAIRMKFVDDLGFFGAAWSPKGDKLALGSGDWSLRFWDVSPLSKAK